MPKYYISHGEAKSIVDAVDPYDACDKLLTQYNISLFDIGNDELFLIDERGDRSEYAGQPVINTIDMPQYIISVKELAGILLNNPTKKRNQE